MCLVYYFLRWHLKELRRKYMIIIEITFNLFILNDICIVITSNFLKKR